MPTSHGTSPASSFAAGGADAAECYIGSNDRCTEFGCTGDGNSADDHDTGFVRTDGTAIDYTNYWGKDRELAQNVLRRQRQALPAARPRQRRQVRPAARAPCGAGGACVPARAAPLTPTAGAAARVALDVKVI